MRRLVRIGEVYLIMKLIEKVITIAFVLFAAGVAWYTIKTTGTLFGL